ncbi:MAG: hypothetical protein GY950_33370 [bacterium]|nr:hypothetical protein [bacterium]
MTPKLITFSFIKKLFQPYVYERVTDVLKNDTAEPLVIELDITSNCNQDCAACISRPLLNKGEIPISKIKSLLDVFSAAGLKAVIFTGGGEPLMHSAMPEPFLYAKETGLSQGLITNGVLLDKFSGRIAGVLSWLRVSIDACEPRKYNLLHYNRSSGKSNVFHNIIASMERFALIKGETRLGFSFLVFAGKQWSGSEYENISQISRACGIAKNTGCDYFEVKPVVEQNHTLSLNPDELARLSEQYDACKEMEDDDFTVYCSESLQNSLHMRKNAGEKEFLQEKTYSKCLVSKLRGMVSPEGIFPCPYFRGNGTFGYLIDLKKDGLTPGEYRKIMTRISRDINPAADCNFYCIRHEQNIILHKLLSGDLPQDKNLKIDPGEPAAEDLFI